MAEFQAIIRAKQFWGGGGGGVEDVDQLVECLSNMHWAWVLPSVQYKPRMAVHACNPSNQEVEVNQELTVTLG